MIGIVAVATILVFVCAAVFVRKKHQAKKEDGEKLGGDVLAIVAEPNAATATDNATTLACDPPQPSGANDVVQAVLEAANNLAQNSQFPGVAEAAVLVKTLVTLISNDRGRIAESEARLKRCRLLVAMLGRAATVLENVRLIDCLHVDASVPVPGLNGVYIATEKNGVRKHI